MTAAMSLPTARGYYRAEAAYAALLREVGLPDAMSVFECPKIEVWRSITERENCILDHPAGRLHIKRNKPRFSGVENEVQGIQLLERAGIASVPIVAWGKLNDGRGFLITDDLVGFDDSEKLVRDGMGFDRLLKPTADLAATLHGAGLHHRDLYLCHFYAKVSESAVELRLMDAGRVRPLPGWFRQRWIVKDVAQFLYSLQTLGVPDELSGQWLTRYGTQRGTTLTAGFRRAVARKIRWIGRHDAKLRQRQPTRNVAIDR